MYIVPCAIACKHNEKTVSASAYVTGSLSSQVSPAFHYISACVLE